MRRAPLLEYMRGLALWVERAGCQLTGANAGDVRMRSGGLRRMRGSMGRRAVGRMARLRGVG